MVEVTANDISPSLQPPRISIKKTEPKVVIEVSLVLSLVTCSDDWWGHNTLEAEA
jgi:hypothetical protein